MEDLPILAAIFGSEELLQYSDELLETMAHLRGRRLNMNTKKVIEELNKFKVHRRKSNLKDNKKNNNNLKTKINMNRSKLSKLKKQVNKCLKTCLTKKIGQNKKSPKNKTRRKKK